MLYLVGWMSVDDDDDDAIIHIIERLKWERTKIPPIRPYQILWTFYPNSQPLQCVFFSFIVASEVIVQVWYCWRCQLVSSRPKTRHFPTGTVCSSSVVEQRPTDSLHSSLSLVPTKRQLYQLHESPSQYYWWAYQGDGWHREGMRW